MRYALLAPPSVGIGVEVRELRRVRKWQVRSVSDVCAVVESLNRECAVGSLTIDLGPGGVPRRVEFEQRSKMSA